jgi:hypothetical protein
MEPKLKPLEGRPETPLSSRSWGIPIVIGHKCKGQIIPSTAGWRQIIAN